MGTSGDPVEKTPEFSGDSMPPPSRIALFATLNKLGYELYLKTDRIVYVAAENVEEQKESKEEETINYKSLNASKSYVAVDAPAGSSQQVTGTNVIRLESAIRQNIKFSDIIGFNMEESMEKLVIEKGISKGYIRKRDSEILTTNEDVEPPSSPRFLLHIYTMSETQGNTGCMGIIPSGLQRRDFTFVSTNRDSFYTFGMKLNELLYDRPIQKRPRRLAVVVNPIGGNRSAKIKYLEFVKPIFNLANIEITEYETQRYNHAFDIALDMDLKTIDGIVCVGGDGIVNEVLNGLMNRPDAEIAKKTPLGLIAAGSQNALAMSAAGTVDPVRHALFIIKGVSRPLDIVSTFFPTRGVYHYGLITCLWGFMSAVAKDSDDYRYMGPSRYIYCALKELVSPRFWRGNLSYIPEDELPLEEKVISSPSRSLVNSSDDNEQTHLSPTPSATSPPPQPTSPSNINIPHTIAADYPPTRPSRPTHMRRASAPVNSCPLLPPPPCSSMLKKPSAGSLLNMMRLSPSSGSLAEMESSQKKYKHVVYKENEWIHLDNLELFNFMAFNVSGANTQTPAACPQADPEDGLLSLCLWYKCSRTEIMKYLYKLQSGKHTELKFIKVFKVRALRFEPISTCPINMDGEILECAPFETQIIKSAATLMCPVIPLGASDS
eukprot:TRINITY_DN1413_c0_g1_i2.p1 TRINITY_DN1413_c0_g1~~TRINITY_DN1413_c0_g1_i2.p1  ORF type:complete len:661 (-),score=208.70 TRINITY_DN1413_c0_g1_i2:184-2166(-)